MKIQFYGEFFDFSEFVLKHRSYEHDEGWKPCPYIGFPEYTFHNSATMTYNLFTKVIEFNGSKQAFEDLEECFLPMLIQYNDKLKEHYKTRKRFEITVECFY